MPARFRRARALICAAALIAAGLGATGSHGASATEAGTEGRIFFMRRANAQRFENHWLVSVKPDGSDEQRVFASPDHLGSFPSLFAGGSKLAYVGSDGVRVANPDGSDDHALPNVNYDELFAASPDGSLGAFSTPSPTSKIVLSNLDGSGHRVLLEDSGHNERWPSWSPDGQAIAYFDDRGLWTMNSDGTSPRMVVALPDELRLSASFSPDGTSLAFVEIGAIPEMGLWGPELFIVNVDGTDLHRVPLGIWGTTSLVSFSPDGARLVFDRYTDDDDSGIYTVKIDGSDLRQLTHGVDLAPVWQPAQPETPPSTTTTTTLPNQKPIARIVTRKFASAPLALLAGGGTSTDPDGTIVKYEWWWGDASAPSTGKSAAHTYARRGRYTVFLRVTDNRGATRTAAKTVGIP